MTQKTMQEVAAILIRVFRTEGNCRRWHSDNGAEFINFVVEYARKELGIEGYSHGRPRHPQCQGLVERANGTCKRKILMKSAEEGLRNGGENWNWKQHLEQVLMQENDAPLKIYKGLTAFFCLRNRERDVVNYQPLNPEDMRELHEFMHACQIAQGAKVVGKGTITSFNVDDSVRVRAGFQEVKKRSCLGTWTTEAIVHEIHETMPNYYKVRWTTRGLGKEKVGTVSKRWYPWTALKHGGNGRTTKVNKANDEEEEEEDADEEDEKEGSTEVEEGEDEEQEAEPMIITMSTCMPTLRRALAEVKENKRDAWHNKSNSCHLDSFIMLELTALAGAPWRLTDKGLRHSSNRKEKLMDET